VAGATDVEVQRNYPDESTFAFFIAKDYPIAGINATAAMVSPALFYSLLVHKSKNIVQPVGAENCPAAGHAEDGKLRFLRGACLPTCQNRRIFSPF
jgi:hypothetical protein